MANLRRRISPDDGITVRRSGPNLFQQYRSFASLPIPPRHVRSSPKSVTKSRHDYRERNALSDTPSRPITSDNAPSRMQQFVQPNEAPAGPGPFREHGLNSCKYMKVASSRATASLVMVRNRSLQATLLTTFNLSKLRSEVRAMKEIPKIPPGTHLRHSWRRPRARQPI